MLLQALGLAVVFLPIADPADKGAGTSCHGRSIAAGFVVSMIAGCRVGQAAATLVMLMTTGTLCCPLGIAAVCRVCRVVFTQAACADGRTTVLQIAVLGKGHGGQQGQHHAQADKGR